MNLLAGDIGGTKTNLAIVSSSSGAHRPLAEAAHVQRLLWASTGVKNTNYPDTLYMDALIGADTVNTVPPATLTAFVDHGAVAATLGDAIPNARLQMSQLAELGIDLNVITQKLQDDGVAAFVDSFESLMSSVAEKRHQLQQVRQR